MAKSAFPARNAAANAIAALCGSGVLRIYAGTVPTSANDALVAQVLLAECVMAAPAFAPSVNGVAVATTIADDLTANNSGVATFWRLSASDTMTTVLQGTVGVLGSGADMEFPGASTYIPVGAKVSVAGFSFTVPE